MDSKDKYKHSLLKRGDKFVSLVTIGWCRTANREYEVIGHSNRGCIQYFTDDAYWLPATLSDIHTIKPADSVSPLVRFFFHLSDE